MNTDHLRDISQSLRTLAQRSGGLKRVRESRNEPSGFQRAYWQAAAELGILGVLVDTEYGGLGLGMAEATGLASMERRMRRIRSILADRESG